MKIVYGTVLALMTMACRPTPSDVLEVAKHAPIEAAPLVAADVDASHGSIAGLHTGMDKDQLLAAGYVITERSVMQEGDEYLVIDVSLNDGSIIECWFDDGRIERLRTTAEGLNDAKGIGVGSTLAALKAAYPDGRLITGVEDGRRYASFVNRSKVVFEMDMKALPQACFHDENIGCDAHPALRVSGVVVHSGPST